MVFVFRGSVSKHIVFCRFREYHTVLLLLLLKAKGLMTDRFFFSLGKKRTHPFEIRRFFSLVLEIKYSPTDIKYLKQMRGYHFDERNLGGQHQAKLELMRFQRVITSTKGVISTREAPFKKLPPPKIRCAMDVKAQQLKTRLKKIHRSTYFHPSNVFY